MAHSTAYAKPEAAKRIVATESSSHPCTMSPTRTQSLRSRADRHQQIRPASQLDHPQSFAPLFHLVTRLQPAHDAPGDGSRNLLDANGSIRGRFLQVDPQLLIAHCTSADYGRRETPSGKCRTCRTRLRTRQSIDMHVEDRQEDADAPGSAAGEVGLVDLLRYLSNLAIGRADKNAGIFRVSSAPDRERSR